MAVVGHWNTLAEAQKLTQSQLLAGVVDTVIESGHLLPMLPVKQVSGQDLKYNREDTWTASAGADFYAIRQQIPWSSDVTYTQKTASLYRIARQDPIDKFVEMTYNNVNDYRALMIAQLAKRITRFAEHNLIYGDTTYTNASGFDGIHALAEELSGDNDIDEGEGALSLTNLRKAIDAVKVDAAPGNREGVFILTSREIGRRLDAAAGGTDATVLGNNHPMSLITQSMNEWGKRVTFFDGIPIIRSDFLVAEEANTGAGSDARALQSTTTNMYSLFVIRPGQTEDGGLSVLFGGDSGTPGDFFRRETFEKLEGFDSGGERLVTYMGTALGAAHSLARIYDITDVAVGA